MSNEILHLNYSMDRIRYFGFKEHLHRDESMGIGTNKHLKIPLQYYMALYFCE